LSGQCGLICSSISLPAQFCHFPVLLILVAIISRVALLAPICIFTVISGFLTRF
jgi:hypothetical protein